MEWATASATIASRSTSAGGGSSRLELLVHLGHPHLPDAVADGVMDDRPDRRAATLEAVDHDEAPQRPRAIEWLVVELGGEVEQLPFGAGRRQHDLTDM